MTTVLITQRLQRDFADTSGPRSHASLLHASYSDAASLFGTIPSAGMEWLAGLGPIGRDQRHSPQSAQDLARFGRLVAEGELARLSAARVPTPLARQTPMPARKGARRRRMRVRAGSR